MSQCCIALDIDLGCLRQAAIKRANRRAVIAEVAEEGAVPNADAGQNALAGERAVGCRLARADR
jgi:hypothetical protein